MVVRELLTRLGFETDEKKVNSFENSIGSLTKGLALLVTGATAAATAMFSFATASARQSKEIDKGAKLAGMNVEEFQKLAYAAKTYGIEQDKLADILKDVNDKMGDYAQTGGGAMADFFEFIAPKVGVTAEQFKNLSGADALQLYVSSLEKANLSQAELTFYMEAIASDSTLLLPLLEKNGEAYKTLAKEAEEYGLVLSEEAIEQNKKFGKQLDKIFNLFTGMKNLLNTKFIPVFSQVLTKIEEFIKKNWQLIRQNLEGFFEGAIWVVERFISIIGTLIGWINKVAQSLGGWTNSLKILAVAIGVVMSLKFIAYLWSLYKALKAVGWTVALGTALGWGMIAAVVALASAIVLLIEDIYQWVAGNESVVGDLIATWFEFVTKIKGYLNEGVDYIKGKLNDIYTYFADTFTKIRDYVSNIFTNLWSGITDGISGAFDKIKSYIPDISLNPFSSNPTPTTQSVLGANGNSLNSVINDNKNINITVPPGTTTEQVEAIKNEINKTMVQQYTDAALNLEGY